MLRCLFFLILSLYLHQVAFGDFEVPDALVQVYHPRGLKVSIPDQEGIKLFAFHGKVNEEMNGREAGFWSRDVTKAKNGRWTFYDPTAQLNISDVIYYWTYVDYYDGVRKLGYPKDDQEFTVTEYLDKKTDLPLTSQPSVTKRPTTTTTTTTTTSSVCKPTATHVNNVRSCAGKLIFHEDFHAFQSNIWTPQVRFAGKPDFEFVLYENRPEVVQILDGLLKIRPEATDNLRGPGFVTKDRELDLGDKCTGIAGTPDCVQSPFAYLILPPVTSAQWTTKQKFAFKYGKVEIRAKLPQGDWIYPELFLNSNLEEYGPDYESGQMRIAFTPGNGDSSHILYGGCILGNSQAARTYGLKTIEKMDGSWTEDFHNFTLIWSPDSITLSVDGKVYGNIYPPDAGFASEAQNLNLKNTDRWRTGSKLAPFDKEMFLTVGVGVGGHCFQDRVDGKKPWINNEPKSQKDFYRAQSRWKKTWNDNSILQVDYIKIWALQ